MTDNGACYRSHAFAEAPSKDITHKRTRPYRPQTNGKVERFNRTLAAEWAYATTYTGENERAAADEAWVHHYNHHRPHTGIGGNTQWRQLVTPTGSWPITDSDPPRIQPHFGAASDWAANLLTSPRSSRYFGPIRATKESAHDLRHPEFSPPTCSDCSGRSRFDVQLSAELNSGGEGPNTHHR